MHREQKIKSGEVFLKAFLKVFGFDHDFDDVTSSANFILKTCTQVIDVPATH